MNGKAIFPYDLRALVVLCCCLINTGELVRRHTRDDFSLIRGVLPIASPVADDRAVILPRHRRLPLIEQRQLQLRVEIFIVGAARQIVGVPFRAPNVAAIYDLPSIWRVRQDKVTLFASAADDRVLQNVEPLMQIQAMGTNAHFFSDVDRRARTDHRIDEHWVGEAEQQTFEEFLVDETGTVTAPGRFAPRATLGKGKNAHGRLLKNHFGVPPQWGRDPIGIKVQIEVDLFGRFDDLPAGRSEMRVQLLARQPIMRFVALGLDLFRVEVAAGIALDDFDVGHDCSPVSGK